MGTKIVLTFSKCIPTFLHPLFRSWELTAAWMNYKVLVPTIFMIGDQDLVYHFPKAQQDIERMAEHFPLLKEITIVEGANHFLQSERPDIVNDHILQFFKNFLAEL
ncbi:hypothetical protein KP509_38G056700 [Ceratopteris richardii]|uniref:Uncharacterized protein n=2 Tax=Ceratopteris richardii TaxID=49495 RepID=A0A8T2Q472_CERRI|nr:hypothetical protein KP509_38G056700 [Ceratopteris richardii]